MKRWFIASLVVLVASVAIVMAMQYDTGYLLISYGKYTLESSVWVGLVFFLLLFAVIYGSFSLLRRSIHGSRAMRTWLSGRHSRRSQEQTTRGLIAFIEGNWRSSRNMLDKAAAKSETPLINYLIAARASHALGDEQQTKHYLKLADQSTTGASIAVDLTQAELQLRSGHLEQSLATLMRVRRNASKHPYVLALLKSVYLGLKDWQELLTLLPELKKHHVIPTSEIEELELTASKALVEDTSKHAKSPREELSKLWQSLPKAVTRNSDVAACYVRELIAHNNQTEAEKIIRTQLRRDWNKALVKLYGVVEGEDPNKQLMHAEAWLQERNNDAILLLSLGRLSLRNSLWGKAREYFENSRKLECSSEVCAELGRLLAHLGEHEKSNQYYEQGLLLTTDVLPRLPMPVKTR